MRILQMIFIEKNIRLSLEFEKTTGLDRSIFQRFEKRILPTPAEIEQICEKLNVDWERRRKLGIEKSKVQSSIPKPASTNVIVGGKSSTKNNNSLDPVWGIVHKIFIENNIRLPLEFERKTGLSKSIFQRFQREMHPHLWK